MKIMLHQKQVYFNANHSTITTDNCNLSTVAEYCEKSVNADRLPNLHCGGSIESTISINGYRTRQTCGIFLSQILLSQGVAIITTPSKAELVTRLISRNKPSNRTNKASRFIAVVETLSHPLGYGKSHLLIAIKRLSKMLFKFLLLGEGSLKFTTPHEFKLNHLLKTQSGISIESTTKHNGGYRSRNTSGIFLPKIHTLNTATSGRCVSIEFVARATLRNKAGNRTNKGGYHPLWLVVEPLPRLLSVSKLSLNNITENFTMLFKFLLLGEKRLTVRIRAKSEAEARQRIQFTSPAICIARFRENTTACNRPNFGEMGEIVHSPMVDGQPTEQKNILQSVALIGYSAPVVAKSTASRRKLNNLSMANDSTPLIRAFLVRSLRTPKENTTPKIGERPFLSMVGRIGQRLGVGCEPLIAVSYPDTLYRQAVGSKAVDIKNLSMELSQMFYKFLFTGSRLRITVFAKNLAEAYKRLPLSQTKPVLIARLPVQGGIYA